MAYIVTEEHAITRNGKHAEFMTYNDSAWPVPWEFRVDGKRLHYSVGGFINNHQTESHELDLVGPLLDNTHLTNAEKDYLRVFLHSENTDTARNILKKLLN
jgi:hypothetical protein